MEPSAALLAALADSDDEAAETNAEAAGSASHPLGFKVIREFIGAAEADRVVASIAASGLLDAGAGRNQAMRFGQLPAWLPGALSSGLQLAAHLPLTQAARAPLFDAIILNSYAPRTGITDHVDLLRFEDVVVGLSLVSACTMRFARASAAQLRQAAGGDVAPAAAPGEAPPAVRVRLNPGDLYILSGEARYEWTHGIAPEDSTEQRISITLRKLCPE